MGLSYLFRLSSPSLEQKAGCDYTKKDLDISQKPSRSAVFLLSFIFVDFYYSLQ